MTWSPDAWGTVTAASALVLLGVAIVNGVPGEIRARYRVRVPESHLHYSVRTVERFIGDLDEAGLRRYRTALRLDMVLAPALGIAMAICVRGIWAVALDDSEPPLVLWFIVVPLLYAIADEIEDGCLLVATRAGNLRLPWDPHERGWSWHLCAGDGGPTLQPCPHHRPFEPEHDPNRPSAGIERTGAISVAQVFTRAKFICLGASALLLVAGIVVWACQGTGVMQG